MIFPVAVGSRNGKGQVIYWGRKLDNAM